MNAPIVVQAPANAPQLMLLFHGVGATADDLVPVGQFAANAFPNAAIVSVPAPLPSDFGSGLQWFSVQGVTEDNRPARVQAAMPAFAQAVREMQQRYKATPEKTTLVGFSQGAIMALESARAGLHLAGRIVSLSGRFALLPAAPPGATRVHFLHGQDDAVVPASFAIAAAEKLGGAATIDLFPGMGHGISKAMMEKAVARLRAA